MGYIDVVNYGTTPKLIMLELIPTTLLIISTTLIIRGHFFFITPAIFTLSIALATTIYINKSLWLGLRVVIIYIGGIIVLITYFISITQSPIIKFTPIWTLPIILIDPSTTDITINTEFYTFINNYIWILPIFTATWLCLRIIIVAHLSSYSAGPLRAYET